jgi:hypothetical protein
MSATLKNFLIPHGDDAVLPLVKRVRGFAKDAKIPMAVQAVTIDAAKGLQGHILSLNATTMTKRRKLRDFAETVDQRYHFAG